MNILRKVLRATAVFAMAMSIPVAAFADTGGGLGGGGSNTSLTGNISWKSIASNTPGRAYQMFLQQSGPGRSQAFTEREITKRVGGLEVCQKSSVIWYVNHNATNKWVYNYEYTGTHGTTWDSNSKAFGTIEDPYVKVGERAPSVAEVNAFKNWDKEKNGNKIDAQPGYTIICSGAFSVDDKTWSTTTSSSKDASKTVTYTYPYSWTTEVKRQITENGIDPIGEDNLHDQKGSSTTSNFGKLWNSLNTTSGQGMTPEQLKTAVNEAVEKDKTIDHSKVTLDEKNKAGMAEGGVLNIYEQTKFATVSSTEITTTVTTTVCNYVQKWNYTTVKFDPATKTCNSTDKASKRSTATKTSGTLKNTGFWQMLSVHCNQQGFNDLINSGNGITVVDSGDSTKAISAVATTKKYDTQPAKLDFGDKTNTNAAKAATGSLGFFDKECPFDCTAASNTEGATKLNGATSNIGANNATVPTVTGGKYGANSGKSSNNFFEFFRDNSKNTISVDVWYPKNVNGVSYTGAAPLTTTFTRWAEGTPSVTGANGGKFTMTTLDGSPLFTGKTKATNQKNWNTSTFDNSTSTSVKGLKRDFTVQSTWASDANKPQVLNVKWEYAPTVATNVYTTNLGFGNSGKQALGTASKVQTAIEGKCYSNYGTDTQISTVQTFHDNTGTGTTNNLDGNLLEGAAQGNNAQTLQSNLVVNFVRATTE